MKDRATSTEGRTSAERPPRGERAGDREAADAGKVQRPAPRVARRSI